MTSLLIGALILAPSAVSETDGKAEFRAALPDQRAENTVAERVEWRQERLFVDGKERKSGGSLLIWIFNVDSEARDITALFVQQSLKRLVLGYGEDEIVLNEREPGLMPSLHQASPADGTIHVQTSEDVYFGDQGCEFDVRYTYADGTTTERLGLDFCANVRGTSGTSGRVGFAVDGNSVLELDSYLAASKSRPYWSRIQRHIVTHWGQE